MICPRNKAQLLLEFDKKWRGVEDMPCCSNRGVAELTDPRIVTILGLVNIADNSIGKAAEITPTDITGPCKIILLPVNPADFMGEITAFEG